MGRGIQIALAAPCGSPKSIKDLIKVPWRSIPEFMFLLFKSSSHGESQSLAKLILATTPIYLSVEMTPELIFFANTHA
jgi:hypothetical protein